MNVDWDKCAANLKRLVLAIEMEGHLPSPEFSKALAELNAAAARRIRKQRGIK